MRPAVHFTGGEETHCRSGRMRDLAANKIRPPDRPGRSETLYGLCYPGPNNKGAEYLTLQNTLKKLRASALFLWAWTLHTFYLARIQELFTKDPSNGPHFLQLLSSAAGPRNFSSVIQDYAFQVCCCCPCLLSLCRRESKIFFFPQGADLCQKSLMFGIQRPGTAST